MFELKIKSYTVYTQHLIENPHCNKYDITVTNAKIDKTIMPLLYRHRNTM